MTGRDYAKHQITEFAKAGDLGNGGRKPGTHVGLITHSIEKAGKVIDIVELDLTRPPTELLAQIKDIAEHVRLANQGTLVA
jgi:hypothetical protein